MTNTSNPFGDFTKILEQFKIPGVDMTSIIEERRKDIEALTQANRIAFEGMQSLVQKQAEILRKTMEEMQEAAKKMASGGGRMPNFTNQGEFAQQALLKAFQNMRELAEVVQKSQGEALQTMNRRALQNMEELKKLMQPK
jgi:phasin family protein